MGATAETWALYKVAGVNPTERMALFSLAGSCGDPDNPDEETYRPTFSLEKMADYMNVDTTELRDALNSLTHKGLIRNAKPVNDDIFECDLAVKMDSEYVW